MSVPRVNVEFAKRIFFDRVGDPYVYGGALDPFNVKTGTDCSGLVGSILEALLHGPAMSWARHVSTESWPYNYSTNAPAPAGTVGPYGTISVGGRHRDRIPADAAATIAIMHGGGGMDSHIEILVDGVVMESGGEHDDVGSPPATPIDHPEWTDYWYLPGPIVDDGTPVTVIEPPDTLYADVSEWQRPVDDSYPYRVIAIRSNDGAHLDKNWDANYAWCKRAADAGRLTCFIVYYYWRPGIDSVAILQQLVGAPHPKMAVMIDVESGGNPRGNYSSALNDDDTRLAQWLGDERRVIAYGNSGDLNALWPDRRENQFVVAGYGSNPNFTGKIAHQYTDGNGYGGGLPEGCPPFGNCDMNAADGYTPTAFAAALGIQSATTTGDDDFMSALTADEQHEMLDLLRQAAKYRRPSTSMVRHAGEGAVNTCVGFSWADDGLIHPIFTGWASTKGHVDSIALCLEVASADLTKPGPDGTPGRSAAQALADASLAEAILSDAKAANPDRFAAALAQIEATNVALLQQYLAKKGSAAA